MTYSSLTKLFAFHLGFCRIIHNPESPYNVSLVSPLSLCCSRFLEALPTHGENMKVLIISQISCSSATILTNMPFSYSCPQGFNHGTILSKHNRIILVLLSFCPIFTRVLHDQSQVSSLRFLHSKDHKRPHFTPHHPHVTHYSLELPWFYRTSALLTSIFHPERIILLE